MAAPLSDIGLESRGRRKQKNPKRKNNVEDDVGVEASAQQPNSPASPSGCHDDKTLLHNGYHGNQTDLKQSDQSQSNGGLELGHETMHNSDLDKASDSCLDKGDHSNNDHDNSLESIQSSDLNSSLDTLNKLSSNTDDKVSSSAHENAVDKSPAQMNGQLHDSGCHDNPSPSNVPQSEEDKIQELMGRSDTAVIFPEPVSDQEDNPNNQSTDDPAQDGEYLLKCPHCQKGFTRVYLLKEHITTLHADKASKHMCPECGVSFALKSHLDKHLCLHSPTAQVCKICNKTFANVYRLSRHMISHEESTELRKFKCPECGKAFKFKHHLKEHIRIHSGEKPFECSNCGKRFSHSGSYSSHMTSKKCWVMNLKMKRGGSEKAAPEPAPGLLRPLVPKAEENGIDLHSMTHMFPGAMIPSQGMLPFDTATQLHSQYINGGRPPFVPHIPFTTGHMISPMMPTGLPGIPFPLSILDDKGMLQKMQQSVAAAVVAASQHKMAMSKPAVDTNLTQSCSPSKVDENQNNKNNTQSDDAPRNRDQVKAKQPEPEVNTPSKETELKTQTDSSALNIKEEKLDALKKVLETVNATIVQQQKNTEDKAHLSKLANQEAERQSQGSVSANEGEEAEAPANEQPASGSSLAALADAAERLEKMETAPEAGEVKSGEEGASQLACRFCKTGFSSAIDLHQHERYLCEENKEIRLSMQDGSSQGRATPKEDDKQSPQVTPEGDIRKCRARSLISEDQHQVLRSYFQTNPRPGKAELEMLAKQTSLPKRVVQVWFQNQRARYRRKGQLMPLGLGGSSGEVNTVSSTTSTSPYIPVVPQVSPPMHYGSSRTPSLVSPPHSAPQAMQVEPLDLSTATRVQPQEAHVHKPFSQKSAPKATEAEEGEVLNLSTKSERPTEEARQFEESAIYKYMQREGMIPDESSSDGHAKSASPSVSPRPPASRPFEARLTSTPHLQPSPGMMLPTSPITNAATASPSHPSLDSSFTSSVSMDSIMGLHDNPAIAPINGKPKRARKKSWRQMESEEFQMEYENALDADEDDEDGGEDDDRPFAKKRRSWKQHKVETGEGMYACDQCDKLFSKQSSLARHKYEHSGQRPFPCDICTKAFKHKHHLTEHKRLHSGEKPFTCKKCGKRFSHSGSYSQHMNHRYKYCKPLRVGIEEVELSDQTEAVC